MDKNCMDVCGEFYERVSSRQAKRGPFSVTCDRLVTSSSSVTQNANDAFLSPTNPLMKTTKGTMTRREFTKAIALSACAVAATPLLAADSAPARKLKIGHTGITWGVFPQNASRPTSSDKLEDFLKDISSQGFYSFECFPQNLADWETK